MISILSRKYIDVRFKTKGNLYTRILERPGLWMSDEDIDKLSSDLRSVAKKTLNAGALDYGVFSSDRSRLSDSILTIIYEQENERPIAFNALAVMALKINGQQIDVIHLGLVMVDPTVRSRGLSWILYGLTCVLLFLRKGLRPIYISNVTQVPAVVGMVTKTFNEVYPAPGDGAPQDFRKIQIARAIMADHRHVFGVGEDADFDETRFIITNAYTGGSDDLKKSFEDAPKHRDETFNSFCSTSLDYDRGDDFLQIGLIDLNAARNFLTRIVPPQSLLGVMSITTLLLLQRFALPIIHWFDDKKQYGVLRPR
ncbi:hypothetical protein [Maritalea myrionectae]|uniref:hypothetical protein n=1 Tax=Maritalea myrionectae TaxID=454601 RepID=UPI0004200187|nr:hypothetical protein [Maritalea myrionectae]